MVRIARASLAFALLLLSLPAPAADGYPQKPIRFIVPFAPGGATEVLARALSDKFGESLGANVIIDTRPGAGSTLGVGMAAHADPDGYTLLWTSASFTFLPSVYKDLPFDSIKDFKPITMVGSVPNLLVVHPSIPVSNVKQLIALARKRPGEIYYGSAGRGSNLHLTTELFLYMAGIKMLHVPYKGGGPAMIALMSGEVHVLMPGLQSGLPFVKQGRMRAIAISTQRRAAALPELPTMDESGVPGYDKAVWIGLFAPAAVPEPIIAHIYQAVSKVLKDPAVVKRLAAEGADVVGNTPSEFETFVREEIGAWGKLIRDMKL